MRIVLDDYESDHDIVVRKRGKVTMKIKRLGVLANETLKAVNNLSPNYVKDIFTTKLHPKVRPNGILFKHHNTFTYDAKRIKHEVLRNGTNCQVTLNQRHPISNLTSILKLGSDLNVDVMSA